MRRRVLVSAGLALLALIVTVIGVLRGGVDPLRRELAELRALAAADDPRLADLLDESMVGVPAGSFMMGSESGDLDERPMRAVYLDAYQIDRYEITNAQYARFVEAGAHTPRYWPGGRTPSGAADMPVVGVSWENAAAYCAWAGERLPSEAEWEKACRGTDGRTYPWGNQWEEGRGNVGRPFASPRPGVWDEAWSFLEATPGRPTMPALRPVGMDPSGASPYGVMDMVGNAAEWVADWYNWSDYSGMPESNPQSAGPQWNHSLRGSSWYLPYGDAREGQESSRCARRNSSHAGDSDARLGFRCVK